MMAAGIASVSAAHPVFADTIAALATTANLIAAIVGVPLTLWISLPVADRFYKFLTRNQKEVVKQESTGKLNALASVLDVPKVNLNPATSLLILTVAGLVTASIVKKGFSFDMVITYALIVAMVGVAIWLSGLTNGKVPALITVILIGTYITSPWFPYASWVLHTAESVDYLSVITLMLAVAGLSIGKDLPMLRQIGWKILPVGFVVIGATFLASAVIAEVVLGILHR